MTPNERLCLRARLLLNRHQQNDHSGGKERDNANGGVKHSQTPLLALVLDLPSCPAEANEVSKDPYFYNMFNLADFANVRMYGHVFEHAGPSCATVAARRDRDGRVAVVALASKTSKDRVLESFRNCFIDRHCKKRLERIYHSRCAAIWANAELSSGDVDGIPILCTYVMCCLRAAENDQVGDPAIRNRCAR